jgi:hypothetical protein
MPAKSALEAFSAAAGISADNVSIFVRTSVLILFFMWAAWTSLELLKYHKKNDSEKISALLNNYIQLFFLVTIIIALVFIP